MAILAVQNGEFLFARIYLFSGVFFSHLFINEAEGVQFSQLHVESMFPSQLCFTDTSLPNNIGLSPLSDPIHYARFCKKLYIF